MSIKEMDLRGLKCPQPTLKLTLAVSSLTSGDIVEVIADCPTFEEDIKGWSQRTKKPLIFIRDEGAGAKRCQVQI